MEYEELKGTYADVVRQVVRCLLLAGHCGPTQGTVTSTQNKRGEDEESTIDFAVHVLYMKSHPFACWAHTVFILLG